MKKLLFCAVCLLCCAAMSSCALTDTLFPSVNSTDDETESAPTQRNAVTTDAADNYDIPFKEGCYSDGNHVMELRYTGDGVKHSYNVGFFASETGVQSFFGTFSPSTSGANAFVAYCYGDNSLRVNGIKLDAQDDKEGFKVTFYYGDKTVKALSGNYVFTGRSWQFDETTACVLLCDGLYENGEYSLKITTDSGSVCFEITNAEGEVEFSESKAGTGELEKVTFDIPDTNCSVIFAAGMSRGKPYVDVVEYGVCPGIKYTGVFSLKSE